MMDALQVAYQSPLSIRTHLGLVAARGLPVTVRTRQHARRAYLFARWPPRTGGAPPLWLQGLAGLHGGERVAQLNYSHAGVMYQFMAELGQPGGDGTTPLELPRRILRSDLRLAQRVDCRKRSDCSARLRWEGGVARGVVDDICADGLGIGQLVQAPAAGEHVEVQPVLAGVVGGVMPATVRHRRVARGAIRVGLHIPRRRLLADDALQGVLRELLGVPLGPLRHQH